MKLIWTLLLSGIFSICLAQNSQSLENKSELLVRLLPDEEPASFLADFHEQYPYELPPTFIKKISRRLNIYLFSAAEEEIASVLDKIKKMPTVISSGRNEKVEYRSTIPDDEDYSEQWYLDAIGMPDAWDSTTGGLTMNGDTIVVAMLERGCFLDHPDLRANIWRNHAEIPDDGIDNDENGYIDDYWGWNAENGNDHHPIDDGTSIEPHGTSVAGIIGAVGDNSIGVAGVNWNIKIMVLSGIGQISNVIENYEYILDMRERYNNTNGESGAFVVATNASFGSTGSPENVTMGVEWCEMYDLLGEVGVLSMGATDNPNRNIDDLGDTPSQCSSDHLIIVTNTNENNELEGAYSLSGDVDLSAPGQNIHTTRFTGGYMNNFPGTSASTPQVTGAIGLIYSLPCQNLADQALSNPSGTALFIKEKMLENVDLLDDLSDRTLSGGRLNVQNTMESLFNFCGGSSDTFLDILQIRPTLATSTDVINIDYSTPDFEEYTFLVYNAIGQLMFEESVIPSGFEKKTFPIPINGWAAGVYFVVLRKGKATITEEIVIYR